MSLDTGLAIPGQDGCDGAGSQGTVHRCGEGRFAGSQRGAAGRELEPVGGGGRCGGSPPSATCLPQVGKGGHLFTGLQHRHARVLFVSMKHLAQGPGEAPGARMTRKCQKPWQAQKTVGMLSACCAFLSSASSPSTGPNLLWDLGPDTAVRGAQ